jgi:hypothetical protein
MKTAQEFSKHARLVGALSALIAAASLAGCGLAETTAVTAAQAEAAAQQAKEGKKLEEKVKLQVEQAQQQATQNIDAAEAAASQ